MSASHGEPIETWPRLRRTQRALTSVHVVWVAILAVLADRAVTLLYWQHEANYVVETLGTYWWTVLTVGMLAALLGTWYGMGMYRLKIGHGIVWLGAGLHGLAVVTNIMWIHGLL